MVAHVALQREHAAGGERICRHVYQDRAGVTEEVAAIQRGAIRRADVDQQAQGPQRVDQEAALAGGALDHQDPRRTLHDDVRAGAVVLDQRVLVGLQLQTQDVVPVSQLLDRQDEATRSGLQGHILAAHQGAVDHQVQRAASGHIGLDPAGTARRGRVPAPRTACRLERHGE